MAGVLFGAWVAVCAAAAMFPIFVLLVVSLAPGAALFGERQLDRHLLLEQRKLCSASGLR